jgi:hypothetical protein
MTKQPPSPETIRTERAFQIYLALINSKLKIHRLPISGDLDLKEIDKKLASELRIFNKISYLAADIFIDVEFMKASDFIAVFGNLVDDIE